MHSAVLHALASLAINVLKQQRSKSGKMSSQVAFNKNNRTCFIHKIPIPEEIHNSTNAQKYAKIQYGLCKYDLHLCVPTRSKFPFTICVYSSFFAQQTRYGKQNMSAAKINA